MVTVLLMGTPARAIEPTWDSVLEQDEFDEPGDWCRYPPRGWSASDGGFSTLAPGNRSIWFFGDTWVADRYPNVFAWEANTILVAPASTPSAPPASSTLKFLGRKSIGAGGAVLDITSDASLLDRAWLPGSDTPGYVNWYWPGKPLVPFNSNTLYTFWEKIRCTTGGYPCGLSEVRLDAFPRVCTTNVSGSTPESWPTPTCINQMHSVAGNSYPPWVFGFWWGSAVIQHGAYVHVYGVVLDAPYDLGRSPKQVVLARTTTANLTNYDAWEFLRPDFSFQPGPPTAPSQLRNVANFPAKHFSVNRIVVNGIAAWLMGQSWRDSTSRLVLRRSDDGWSGQLWPDYAETSDQFTMIKHVNVVDARCGSVAHHQTGQWHLSNQASKKLLMSYFCHQVDHGQGENVSPWDVDGDLNAGLAQGSCDPGDTEALGAFKRGAGGPGLGRIRFYNQDLLKIRPWCTSGCDTP